MRISAAFPIYVLSNDSKAEMNPPNHLVSVVSLCRNSAGTLGLGPTECGISREKLLQELEGSKTAGP